MKYDDERLEWIHGLSDKQLRQYLEDRGLSARGIIPVLRVRFVKFKRAAQGGTSSLSDVGDEIPEEVLTTEPKIPISRGNGAMPRRLDERADAPEQDTPTISPKIKLCRKCRCDPPGKGNRGGRSTPCHRKKNFPRSPVIIDHSPHRKHII